MLSESGTLEDYGNPKLITAGLVQREIPDVLDTDPFQAASSSLGLSVRVRGQGGRLRVCAEREKQGPFPFEAVAAGLLYQRRWGEKKKKI